VTGRYAAPGVVERLLPELARAYEVLATVRALAHDLASSRPRRCADQ
jgi:hypothetical protein